MEEYYQTLVDLITGPVFVLVFPIVLVTMVANYLSQKLFDRLERKTEDTVTIWDDALLKSIRRPLSWLIWVLGIAWAAELLSAQVSTGLGQMIDPVRYIAVVALFTLFLIRFVRECESGFIHKGVDLTTANAIGKLIRISIFITAALTVLQTLGVSVSGILAFGGVGGIAVGFAAKDLLANFFGGLMIFLDRPFAVGDWIRSPDREIEGTVENIGWRLTLIRTFDQRPLYVPNSVFANVALENPSRMRNRRIYETIGLRYADTGKAKAIIDDVRTLLENHEDIDPGRTLIVNLNAFASSSVDFFVYTFTKTSDWVKYHGIKEKIMLQIYAIVESHGAELAFPTSTVHLEPGEAESE